MKGGIVRKTITLSSEQLHQFSSSSLPFLSLLEKCTCLKDLKKIHAHALTSGLSLFAYITSRILARYTDTGDMNNAYQLECFDGKSLKHEGDRMDILEKNLNSRLFRQLWFVFHAQVVPPDR